MTLPMKGSRVSVSILGLDFVVFNDGWTADGFVVFGFACTQVPGLEYYSTNNPNVWVE